MPIAPLTQRQTLGRSRKAYDRLYEERRQRDPKLAQARCIRTSARWQRFRKWFKMRHPSCCDRFLNHQPQPTEHIHKSEALERRGESTKELSQGGRGQSLELPARKPCTQASTFMRLWLSFGVSRIWQSVRAVRKS